MIFLDGVKAYLYGDLSNFDRLCKEAEEREEEERKKVSTSQSKKGNVNYTNSFDPNIPNTSTTSKQTTSLPNSVDSLDKETIFFRSTIPHILTVLSTNDLVGFLLGDLPVSPTNTVENLKKFFSDSIKEFEIKYLNFFYRHGMVHTFFPKNKFGINAHSSNPKNTLFFSENDTIVLNANYLIELTKQRLEVVLSDKTKYDNMKNQFLKLVDYDNVKIKKLQPDIETFKKWLQMI